MKAESAADKSGGAEGFSVPCTSLIWLIMLSVIFWPPYVVIPLRK
tara:strand:- start:566 stop:700 length:135 start_codon:yes stop_codon:yes gene_type:complete